MSESFGKCYFANLPAPVIDGAMLCVSLPEGLCANELLADPTKLHCVRSGEQCRLTGSALVALVVAKGRVHHQNSRLVKNALPGCALDVPWSPQE